MIDILSDWAEKWDGLFLPALALLIVSLIGIFFHSYKPQHIDSGPAAHPVPPIHQSVTVANDQVPPSLISVFPRVRSMKDGDEGKMMLYWYVSVERHVWLDLDGFVILSKRYAISSGDLWVRKDAGEYHVEVSGALELGLQRTDADYESSGYARAAEVKVVDK